MLAICDAERPAVIAGIFGAEFAEVGDATTTVLLEAATFDGPAILDTSLRLGLRTESSSRFEKGLPRELPPRAMAIACRLLVELAGARLVPGTLDALVPPPERPPVTMRHARVPRDPRHRGRAGRVGGDPDAPGLRVARIHARGAHGDGAVRARRRPHPRDRPDRGGRAHPRPRRHPGRDAARRRAAGAAARRRRSSTGSSGSPPTSACPRRSPTTSSPSRTPTPCTWRPRPAPRRRAPRPPDERRDGRDAPLLDRGPAAGGGPQPGSTSAPTAGSSRSGAPTRRARTGSPTSAASSRPSSGAAWAARAGAARRTRPTSTRRAASRPR